MKQFNKIIILFMSLYCLSGFGFKRMDYEEGRVNNVCKVLKGNVLVYFVFVDSKETYPWTEFDIQSTIDSMQIAVNWIEKQAKKNDISLNIISDYHIGEEYTTVKRNLPMGTILSTLDGSFKKGLEQLNEWGDDVAKRVGMSVEIPEKDGIPEIKSPRDKERLISFLRDQNQVESVALIYFVNNYFKDDISLPINLYADDDVEFSIVSYKYPSVIAHNILHLFGAADLYETPYRRHERKIELANEYFDNEIMQDSYGKGIHNLLISDYTKYLIGWQNELDKKYKELLTDKIINF